MSGFSTSGEPKASRCRAWCSARRHRMPHHPRRDEDGVEPDRRGGAEQRHAAHAPPRRPGRPRCRRARPPRSRAERLPSLVLQPGQPPGVAAAGLEHAGHREEGQPGRVRARARGRGRSSESRDEPLLPGEPVGGAAPRPGRRAPAPATVVLSAQVRAALPLGDREAARHPSFSAGRAAPTRRPARPAAAARRLELLLGAQCRGPPRRWRRAAPRCPVSVCDQTTRAAARATCAGGRGVVVPRRRREAGADARAGAAGARRGGTPPRRPGVRRGRGCAAAAGSGRPTRPSAACGRCRPAGRGRRAPEVARQPRAGERPRRAPRGCRRGRGRRGP